MKRGLFLILPTLMALMIIAGAISFSFFSESKVIDDEIEIINVEKNYCESRPEVCTLEYVPVCGYFFKDEISAVNKRTYSNSCTACSDERVEFWTEGECNEN